MKKVLALFLLFVVVFSLSACNGDVVAIEDYEWKMDAVMRNDIEVAQNEDELVVAVGEEDDIHPNAKIVDLKLVANDGSITVTDATNNKSYSGTYKVQRKTPNGTDYEVTIDGIKGYATVAPTEYYDGSEVPTLPINLGDFSLYFTHVE